MAKKVIRLLRSESDYEAALDEIERYFEAEPRPGTPEADRFDLLALVIEEYERSHWPVEAPNPVDAIRYRMETGGYSQADLGRLLGSRQRASEILSGKRPLTLQMIWKLHREWEIPAEALIRPPAAAKPRGLRSSVIRSFRYERAKQRLSITFVSGRTYVYGRIPPRLFRQFEAAESKGEFFNAHIRDRYEFAEAAA